MSSWNLLFLSLSHRLSSAWEGAWFLLTVESPAVCLCSHLSSALSLKYRFSFTWNHSGKNVHIFSPVFLSHLLNITYCMTLNLKLVFLLSVKPAKIIFADKILPSHFLDTSETTTGSHSPPPPIPNLWRPSFTQNHPISPDTLSTLITFHLSIQSCCPFCFKNSAKKLHKSIFTMKYWNSFS